ncbi:MAG: hypothetical protein RLZZ468_1500, partial [Cyanobacteriota bacterium]
MQVLYQLSYGPVAAWRNWSLVDRPGPWALPGVDSAY